MLVFQKVLKLTVLADVIPRIIGVGHQHEKNGIAAVVTGHRPERSQGHPQQQLPIFLCRATIKLNSETSAGIKYKNNAKIEAF